MDGFRRRADRAAELSYAMAKPSPDMRVDKLLLRVLLLQQAVRVKQMGRRINRRPPPSPMLCAPP